MTIQQQLPKAFKLSLLIETTTQIKNSCYYPFIALAITIYVVVLSILF